MYKEEACPYYAALLRERNRVSHPCHGCGRRTKESTQEQKHTSAFSGR